MRILFIGDSLGLPRPYRINDYSPTEKELAISYENTYSSIINFELLTKYKFNPFVEVVNRSKRFYTIKNIHSEFVDHLFFSEPDVIVMQVGIVDCWFREQLGGKQMVPLGEYEKYLINILKLLNQRPNCRLIMVGIAPTSTKMDNRYKGINNEISAYNRVLKSYVNNKTTFYIDLEKHLKPESTNEYLLPDDHHLNKAGNKLLSQLLIENIVGFIESDKGAHNYTTGNYDQSLMHFLNSFNNYPFYIDNLYNSLYLSNQLGKYEMFNQIAKFINENTYLINDEIEELIKVLVRKDN